MLFGFRDSEDADMSMKLLDYHKQNARCRERIVLVDPVSDRLVRMPLLRLKRLRRIVSLYSIILNQSQTAVADKCCCEYMYFSQQIILTRFLDI